jgi:uncharacterized protein (TIGR00369 family)
MLTTAPRAYGVADPAEVRLMTGREFLQAMLDGRLPTPPIMKTLSFSLTEIGDGFAAFEGDTGPHLLNPLGIVHGGWAMTLIDSAAGCAAHTLLPAGGSYATIETKANFSSPSPRTRGASAPKGARSAAVAASSPARRGSSTPRAASLRTGPRRSWSWPALARLRNPRRRRLSEHGGPQLAGPRRIVTCGRRSNATRRRQSALRLGGY